MRVFAVGAGVVLWLLLRSAPARAEPAATAPPSYPGETEPPSAAGTPPRPAPHEPAPAGTPSSQPVAPQRYPDPAPGYAYPPPPAYGWQGAPATLPYRDDKPIPPGYRLVERTRTGLVVAGAIVLGVPYVIGLSFVSTHDSDSGANWLIVPGIGPWMALGARRTSCSQTTTDKDPQCVGDAFAVMGLVFDGILQTTGATLLIVGLAVPKHVLVRQDVAGVTLGRVGSGYGMVMRSAF